MSLFEYAQEVVSRKLERKEPVLSGMGMQPVMPMAQGGGLSSVQNSLNINGQPHRLAYINPSEENLLKSLGGSGRKIDGIPAYDDSVDGGSNQGGPDDGIDDSVDGGSNQSAPDTDVGSFGTMGLGGYTDAQAKGTTQGLDDAMANNPDTFGADPMGVVGNVASFANDPTQSASMGLGTSQNTRGTIDAAPPDIGFFGRAVQGLLGFTNKGYNVNPDMTYSQNIGIGVPGTASAVAAALGFDPSIATVTGPTTSPGGNQGDNDDDAGTDAGGDDAADYIIKEKIAAVKQVPVEEVTVEEVQRAKRLTAAQRVTGTRLEDILDDVYGSGKGSELLSLAQSGGGIASLQKNININGQPHQLSYINPSEENLLRQIGGSGEKINGIPAYMMAGDDDGGHGYGGDDSASTGAAADAANAAQDAAMGQIGGDVIPPEPEPVVAPKAPEVIVPEVVEAVLKEPKVINKNLENILATSYPNLSKSAIASMLGGLAAKEEKDSEEDFETDAKIIEILKEEGNPFPTPDDIKKFKSESNIKTALSQVYGNSNLLNNQTGTA